MEEQINTNHQLTEGQLAQAFFAKKFKTEKLRHNIKLLRNTYGMTFSDVCGLECYFRRTTLHSWENGIRIPTADSLLIYAASFGVSIDWLYGVSQVPYTLQSIDYAEETYYQGIASAWNEEEIDINLFDDSVSERKFVSRLLENYCKHRTRQREFSPEARANIMVLHKFASSIAMLHQFNLELDKNRLNPNLFTKNEKKKYKQIVEKMVEVVNTTYPVYIISDEVSSLTEQ